MKELRHYFYDYNSNNASFGYVWLPHLAMFCRFTDVSNEDDQPELKYVGCLSEHDIPIEKWLGSEMIFKDVQTTVDHISENNFGVAPVFDKRPVNKGVPFIMANGLILNIEPETFPLKGYSEYKFNGNIEPLVLSVLDRDFNPVKIPEAWAYPMITPNELPARLLFLRKFIHIGG